MSGLPRALAAEIEELGRFEIRHSAVVDQLVLTAEVRGVGVVLNLDADEYPAAPPRLELASGWTWGRSRGEIHGLQTQEHWNRTLGIGALLRELEQRFIDLPPRRRKPRRGAGWPGRLWRWIVERLASLRRRLFGGGEPAGEAASMPGAIRARYQEIIGDKTSRIERYKQAVARLMTQGQRKNAGLEALGAEIRGLERDQETTLAEAERRVEQLTGEGRSDERIREDATYRRCLRAYEDRAADLEELRQRFAELEADAREHHDKIGEHEARLEGLIRELDEVRQEAAEVSADLITVELEQEIADLRAGIARPRAEGELRDLLRQYRKAKAAVRLTREVADRADEPRDSEYLEVARRVDAARRFEASLGLGEAREAEPGPAREARDESR